MVLFWWQSPLRQARRAARAGDRAAATAAYRRHLARHPGDAAAWMQLGHACKEQGDLAAATAAYREAVRIAPDVADSWIHLAFLERGDCDAAFAALERAIAIDSGSAAAIAALVALGARERLPVPVQRRIEAEEGAYARSRYAAWREAQADGDRALPVVPAQAIPAQDGPAQDGPAGGGVPATPTLPVRLADSTSSAARSGDDPPAVLPAANPSAALLPDDAPPDVLAVIDGRGAAPGWIALTRATLCELPCLILTDDPPAGNAAAGVQPPGHAGAHDMVADGSADGGDAVAPGALLAPGVAFAASRIVGGAAVAGGGDAISAAGHASQIEGGARLGPNVDASAASREVGHASMAGDAIPPTRHLLLVEAGTRLAPGAVAALRAAVAGTGAGAAYGDHDYWVEAGGGVVYRDPCFQPMFDPLWFARAAVRPPCLLVTAAAAAPHATWAALFAARLALPVAYAHVPRLLASRAADAVAAAIMPLPAHAMAAGAEMAAEAGPRPETGTMQAAGAENLPGAGAGERPVAPATAAPGAVPRPEVVSAPEAGTATDLHAIPPAIPGTPGAIQVIVQTRDAPDMLEACIETLRATADRPDLLDIVIVDNRSILPRTAALLAGWAARGIARVIAHDEPFNWARANNLAAAPAGQGRNAPYLLFLNNDVEMTSTGWDTALRAGLALDGVGAMGALLLYPDGLIQHAGVVFAMGDGGPLHEGIGQPPAAGPADRWRHPRLAAAVTGAWLAVTRALFDTVGGYEERLPVGYNDVDFCLRVRAAGQGIMQASHIVAIHRESATRGIAMSPAAQARDAADWAWMLGRWGAALDLDPACNPHWLREGRPFDGLATPSDEAVARWIAASARSRPWRLMTVVARNGG